MQPAAPSEQNALRQLIEDLVAHVSPGLEVHKQGSKCMNMPTVSLGLQAYGYNLHQAIWSPRAGAKDSTTSAQRVQMLCYQRNKPQKSQWG